MTSKRFFAASDQIRPPFITLRGREHHHLTRVVRIKPGQDIEIFDDKGRSYRARVEKIDSSSSRLRIKETLKKNPPRFELVLAAALIKSKAMDWIIQKSTELGAASIQPLSAERSVVKPGSNISNKINRWEKIALDAAKQCGRSQLPRIHSPLSLSDFLKTISSGISLCLYEHENIRLKDILINSNPPNKPVYLLVGPEGGWTEMEKKDIVQHGFRMASLGRRTLRSETAAISGLAIISHFWML